MLLIFFAVVMAMEPNQAHQRPGDGVSILSRSGASHISSRFEFVSGMTVGRIG
jgi:hypothetical protein